MTRALVIGLAALLVAPALSSAAEPLPVGQSKGVKITRPNGSVVVTFTKRAARLHKRLAGKRVGIWCTTLADPDDIGLVGTGSGGSSYRVPKRRRSIDTGDLTRDIDFCRLWRPPHTVTRKGERQRVGRRLLVSIPLTQRGAVHLDELEKTGALLSLLLIAGEWGDEESDTFPTPAELLARFERETGSAPTRLIALSLPSATPPAGSVGYYSDGAKHAAVVTLSASGRRLFIEVSADQTLFTNVPGYLGGDEDL